MHLCVHAAKCCAPQMNANADLQNVNSGDTTCAKCQHVFSRTLVCSVIGLRLILHLFHLLYSPLKMNEGKRKEKKLFGGNFAAGPGPWICSWAFDNATWNTKESDNMKKNRWSTDSSNTFHVALNINLRSEQIKLRAHKHAQNSPLSAVMHKRGNYRTFTEALIDAYWSFEFEGDKQ